MAEPLADRLKKEGNPLVDGNQVTFVWEGETAPLLISDFTDWEYQPVTLDETGQHIRTYQFELPSDAYIEYAFLDPQTGERLADAYNPRQISNGTGKMNHYFWMPGATKTELTERKLLVARGSVKEYDLKLGDVFHGQERKVWLYQPPTSGPAPLMLVYDGDDFYSRGRLTQIVDNLIVQKRIDPIAMVMVSHGGPQRFLEYGCSDITLGLFLDVILPYAKNNLDILDPIDEASKYGVMGASMGGAMSLYTALRLPGLFGKVLSLSGAFSLEYDLVVYDLVRHLPPEPLKIWMAAGRFEWLLPTNRRMYELLVERDYPVNYLEYNAGHNYSSWRNIYHLGLEYLYGKDS
jgi:enterochelin esterase family protein